MPFTQGLCSKLHLCLKHGQTVGTNSGQAWRPSRPIAVSADTPTTEIPQNNIRPGHNGEWPSPPFGCHDALPRRRFGNGGSRPRRYADTMHSTESRSKPRLDFACEALLESPPNSIRGGMEPPVELQTGEFFGPCACPTPLSRLAPLRRAHFVEIAPAPAPLGHQAGVSNLP
jgi:hypothetical protein